MKGVFAYKVGMTRVFDEAGKVVPVSVLKVYDMLVTSKKTLEKDGYTALQVGFGDVKNSTKTREGFFKKNNLEAKRTLREFPLEDVSGFELGAVLNASVLNDVQYVDVTGVSKGKGFQGGMKRHHFSGGRATHGARTHRAGGSIGMNADPSRVFKGKRMAGHMGNETVTTQRLTLFKNDLELGVLLIKGSVPGANGTLLRVRESVKSPKAGV